MDNRACKATYTQYSITTRVATLQGSILFLWSVLPAWITGVNWWEDRKRTARAVETWVPRC